MSVLAGELGLPVNLDDLPDHLEQLAQEVRLDQRVLTDCLDHPGRTELNHILDCLESGTALEPEPSKSGTAFGTETAEPSKSGSAE
uniref:Uncharacterized protein n=1 Tax=Globodera rostochiensis TaxID=31243 RepID=A0A914IBC4_GLORO